MGRGIALALAEAGSAVAIWDVDEAAAETSQEIIAMGRAAVWRRVDVSHKPDVTNACTELMEAWGRIDVLVNNAGICRVKTIEEISEAEWDQMMKVNLKSVLFCSQAVMPIMKRQRAGTIINQSSIAAKIGGIASGAHYAVSKAGVICLTKCLARELAPYKVTVNALAPGAFDTDMTRNLCHNDLSVYQSTIPLGRVGQIEDLAQVAVFLASDAAAYLTGEIIDVNGGALMD